jgi:hypothetical protein
MRLVSFLTQIERAVVAESSGGDDGAWDCSRMMNFHRGLARLTLQPRPNSRSIYPAGTIFLQAYELADGSACLKATLGWSGRDRFSVIAVYSTPTTDWALEASRIGAAWREGPPAQQVVSTATESLSPLAVAAG